MDGRYGREGKEIVRLMSVANLVASAETKINRGKRRIPSISGSYMDCYSVAEERGR